MNLELRNSGKRILATEAQSAQSLSGLSSLCALCLCGKSLEIKLVNIVFVEDERLAEQDVVALDLHFAKFPGFESLCAGFELVPGHGDGCLYREIAQVHRVPKNH